jgi:hypothetical protein
MIGTIHMKLKYLDANMSAVVSLFDPIWKRCGVIVPLISKTGANCKLEGYGIQCGFDAEQHGNLEHFHFKN